MGPEMVPRCKAGLLALAGPVEELGTQGGPEYLSPAVPEAQVWQAWLRVVGPPGFLLLACLGSQTEAGTVVWLGWTSGLGPVQALWGSTLEHASDCMKVIPGVPLGPLILVQETLNDIQTSLLWRQDSESWL